MSYSKPTTARNAVSHGPLFDWSDRRQCIELPLSAKRLAKRFRMAPATARTVSELAFGAGGVL
jgi:phosphopantothenoylcysteine synthetase/decarboxylase